MRSTVLRFLRLALLLAPVAGCGGDGGSTSATAVDPNVAIVIESQQLVAVSSRSCHVQGTLRNTATEPVDTTLRWQAFDRADRLVGTTAASVDVPAGVSEPFDATGFFNEDDGLIPCSRIARFERILA